MNRTIRAIIGAVCILLIAFCAISIFQNIGKSWKADVTDQKLYTLSDGTKAILSKLHQKIVIKFYYAKTAALKGPDQIKFFNNYYEFVKSLLEEYVVAAKGMVELQVIDPRPFSQDEVDALQFGLKRFSITEEESFFFGLVVRTPFGIEKAIPFFSPDRQNFVEYDISYLIDTAITRQKKSIGIMSSLPVMGQDISPYMAQMMRMQNQRPEPPWTIVEQLRKKYEVKSVATDVNEITDVDILLVIHPKELPEQALFAIDQFVLKGGKTIVCVDPYSMVDKPDRMAMQMGRPPSQSSDLNVLLRNWGLEMPANTFAGDKALAGMAPMGANRRAEKVIGFLNLVPSCFNNENVITAQLNEVNILFAGVLKKVDVPDEKESGAEIRRTPLLMTTNRGNSWTVSSPYELMIMDPSNLMSKFIDGDGVNPVHMAYLVTGRFKSSFPDGIEIEVDSSEEGPSEEGKDPNDKKKTIRLIPDLKEAKEVCAVAVFADVDFISDMLAYRDFYVFGKVPNGDNAALIMNTIDDLGGSSDLISIRSRGNFRRPFVVVDRIETEAEAETAKELTAIEVKIAGFNRELQSILASAKQGEEEVVGSSIVQKRRELELEIQRANSEKRVIQMKRRERIDSLGGKLQRANTLIAPAVILIIAILVSVRRSIRKRHYISHTSDA
ncbi:MAG: Gldg family protein [Phycisphaerae bacterium]|nr:Gldg family protein [Phycisphaerae bacterium]